MLAQERELLPTKDHSGNRSLARTTSLARLPHKNKNCGNQCLTVQQLSLAASHCRLFNAHNPWSSELPRHVTLHVVNPMWSSVRIVSSTTSMMESVSNLNMSERTITPWGTISRIRRCANSRSMQANVSENTILSINDQWYSPIFRKVWPKVFGWMIKDQKVIKSKHVLSTANFRSWPKRLYATSPGLL